ncbi:MAG: hypothetical protein OEY49_09020, partial [Candidatus Heimdallarchaeota archaeon]|nr:hypothetical protein [Candidatus Heimdallarchaeota archaeon]
MDTVTTTGNYSIIMRINSLYVSYDCDDLLGGAGDWHVYISKPGFPVLWSGEKQINDGQNMGIGVQYTYSNIQDTSFTIKIVENDNSGTDLNSAINSNQCPGQTTVNIPTSSISPNTYINAQVNIGYGSGFATVYYSYYVYDNAPSVSSPATVSAIYGQSITYPTVSITDQGTIQTCEYDYQYNGATFTTDRTFTTDCSSHTIDFTNTAYPTQSGTTSYAIRVKDSNNLVTTVTGSLILTNNQPVISSQTTVAPQYELGSSILLKWAVDDFNLDTYQIYMNNTMISQGNIGRVVNQLTYNVQYNYVLSSIGTHN